MNKFKHHMNQKGFTLVEILVAMTILSLILILLFNTLFTTNRSWQATERIISKNDELRLVGDFLRRQLSQTTPLVGLKQRKQQLIFEGKTNELRFTSVLPSHRGGGGVQIITLKMNNEDEKNQLNLFYEYANPDYSPFDEKENIQSVNLLENISDIELTYFGADKINEEPTWRDEWENKDHLPLLINLKVRAFDEVQNWPELKIPLYSSYIKGRPEFILYTTKASL